MNRYARQLLFFLDDVVTCGGGQTMACRPLPRRSATHRDTKPQQPDQLAHIYVPLTAPLQCLNHALNTERPNKPAQQTKFDAWFEPIPMEING